MEKTPAVLTDIFYLEECEFFADRGRKPDEHPFFPLLPPSSARCHSVAQGFAFKARGLSLLFVVRGVQALDVFEF